MAKERNAGRWFWSIVFVLVILRLFGGDLYRKWVNPISSTEGAWLGERAPALRGFLLYVDLDVDRCSTCFSEVNDLEKIKEVYPDLEYSIVIRESDLSEDYYRNWIRENVNANFKRPVWIDNKGSFQGRYGLGQGSKVFFLIKTAS